MPNANIARIYYIALAVLSLVLAILTRGSHIRPVTNTLLIVAVLATIAANEKGNIQ